MAPHVSRLFVDFRHPDDVVDGIESIEGCRLVIHLIAENEDEISHCERLIGRWNVFDWLPHVSSNDIGFVEKFDKGRIHRLAVRSLAGKNLVAA